MDYLIRMVFPQKFIIYCLRKKMSKNKTNNPTNYLLIKLQQLQFRNKQIIKPHEFVYFSFALGDRRYFSSSIKSNTPIISDDIIIPIMDGQLPQFLVLDRWQNHMIMLSHEIDITQLRTRTTTKKKHQTKAGQILSFMILVLNDEELKFGDKYIQSISQHYLIIQQMNVKQNRTQQRADIGPSYYMIKSSGADYIMPILDGQICIKLPETLQFEHIRNNKSVGKSKQYTSDQLKQNSIEIELTNQHGDTYSLLMNVRWGINFFQTKTQNSLLLQAHQLLIYDVEVKFDSYNQYANSKVKFVYGNKGFQVGNEFNTSKPSKIKKIVYFIIKSEDQEIGIVVQRNLKIVAQSKFYTDQISSYIVHNPKRKLLDQNGKIVGSIKFKCEKAKCLSTPSNNKFWKQSNKKKLTNMVLLSIEQISVFYQKEQPVCVVIKSQSQERTVNNTPNIIFFDKQAQISYAPVVISAKPDENVYLMVKSLNGQKNQQNQSQNDFIGIAILNFSELRLGINSTQIPFFKNQGKTVVVNCLINKVTPYPFVKSAFQPEILQGNAHKTMSLSIFMKRVIFTPYYYTYRYDNKNEVYCIVQVNRLKKVLIMQNTIHDELSFIPSSSSDSLNFYIEDTQYIKVKITFLISDVGQEEQIYGSAMVKFKIGQLSAAQDGLKYYKVELKNDFGTDAGNISFQVHQGSQNIKPKQQNAGTLISGPFKSQIKKVQNDINQIHQNMQQMQKSIKKNKSMSKSPPLQKIRKSQDITGSIYAKKPSARYDNSINYRQKRRQRNHSVAGTNNQSIKLPDIKSYKNGYQNNSINLINMMQIRKRDTKGYHEQTSKIKQFIPKKPASLQGQYTNINQKYDPSFKTQKYSRENPYLDRNLDLMNINKKPKHSLQKQIEQYEQKLKGLKKQLNNIDQRKLQDDQFQDQNVKLIPNSNDEHLQPSIPFNDRPFHNDLEFQDNQFARPVS